VTLRFEDGSQETLHVAAISEAVRDEDRDHSLSIDSPLGRALAGTSPGDVVRYHTPGGARAAHVMAIEPPD
jgi:transcription elongation GreA/GreB family factor